MGVGVLRSFQFGSQPVRKDSDGAPSDQLDCESVPSSRPTEKTASSVRAASTRNGGETARRRTYSPVYKRLGISGGVSSKERRQLPIRDRLQATERRFDWQVE